MKENRYYKFLAISLFPMLSIAYEPTEDDPLNFNTAEDPHRVGNSYKPQEIIKPAIDGLWAKTKEGVQEHVILHASLSKKEFTTKEGKHKGMHCVVKTGNNNQEVVIGKCEEAIKFIFIKENDGKFRLATGTGENEECLVLTDVFKLEKCSDSTVLTFVDLAFVNTKSSDISGRSYYRQALKYNEKDFGAVFAQYNKKGSITGLSLEVKQSLEGENGANTAQTGLQLSVCQSEDQKCWKSSTFEIKSQLTNAKQEIKNLTAAVEKVVKSEKKPNLVFFFIDTFRADSISKQLTPNIVESFLDGKEKLPFNYAISGATATHHSTYSLLNMRPAYERETLINDDNNNVNFLKGGIAPALFEKLGYETIVFSRPDWFNTFLPNIGKPNKPNKDNKDNKVKFLPSYMIGLPFDPTQITYANDAKKIDDINKIYKGDDDVLKGMLEFYKKGNYKNIPDYIDTDTLNNMTNDMHDVAVIELFERYLTKNEDEVKEGGKVFFVYLSGAHSPHVPNEYVQDKNVLKAHETRVKLNKKYNGLFFSRKDNNDIPLGNAEGIYFDELNKNEALLQKTYYNQIQLIDNLVDRVLNNARLKNSLIALMGDHGEGLGENRNILHGHRPMQKIIETPFLLARKNETGEIIRVKNEKVETVTTMDIFPTILKELNMNKAYNEIKPYIWDRDFRDKCHLSVEPNGDASAQRFIIFDEENKIKSLLLAGGNKGIVDTDKVFLTKLTDYFDNPLPFKNKEIKYVDHVNDCIDILFKNQPKHKGAVGI